MSDSLVIIPTYNEIENIEDMIHLVMGFEQAYHVLVVDDNSPDGTAAKVLELQSQYPQKLHLIVRKKKQGLGKAYIHGFGWALERDYAYIMEMDADFSHDPKDLKKLYDSCKNGADMAIGSRYKHGVNVVNWPLSRVLLSYGASFYVKLITGMRIHDPTAGFVCYRRKALEAIGLQKVMFVGYAFQIEMKYRVYRKKFKIEEVSIIFKDRTKGKSKMHGGIIREGIVGVLKLRLLALFGRI
ncbi:MAG: polyprenol monophosphomannose synthase [Flavobacteriaceae bacterium]|nr:polyprenol monophosphomannose synthase [Flavobacteriaceae bacterium]